MASSLNHAMLPASWLDGKQQLGGEERGEGERKPGQREQRVRRSGTDSSEGAFEGRVSPSQPRLPFLPL